MLTYATKMMWNLWRQHEKRSSCCEASCHFSWFHSRRTSTTLPEATRNRRGE